MVSLRDRVKDAPRDFCCAGRSKSDCHNPQYPKNPDADESIGCPGFRCTRCKGTVGWCKGCDHGDDEVFKTPKRSNGWCDDCWCDVYGDPRQAILKAFARVKWVISVECEEYRRVPTVMLSIAGGYPASIRKKKILIGKVRKLGINYPIYIDTGNVKTCLSTPTS